MREKTHTFPHPTLKQEGNEANTSVKKRVYNPASFSSFEEEEG